MDNPIFVVGLPRTGSTLWENIIAENHEVLRLAEMLYLTPWRKDFIYFLKTQVGDLAIEKNLEKMIELIFSQEIIKGITGSFWRFENIPAINDPNLKRAIYNKIVRSDNSLKSIFKILIEEITHFSGYSRCSVAFPVYPNHIPELLQWYPECKILHVTRDPRAIAISKTNDPSGTAIMIKKYPRLRFIIRKIMILFVVVQYIWTSRLHVKYKRFYNYDLFRYEDLLVNPEKEVRRLCEFTGLNFSPKMLVPKEAMKSSVNGKQQESINIRAASHWKDVITPLEEKFITLLTKSSMRRFGYDPENHPVYTKASLIG